MNPSRKNSRNDLLPVLLLSFACAFGVLLFASTSSPVYATNFWTDTNIYFTIGRGLRHGLMPYRDLFDHKGPLLFLIYGLAALISESNFLGVFLLEVISLTVFLATAFCLLRLYGKGSAVWLSIPACAAVCILCTAFTQGGSAEEFCLPALLGGIFFSVRHVRSESPLPWNAFLFGVCMGWCFWIKYTVCGLFFGLAACLLLREWFVCGFVKAFLAGMRMLAGLAALTLPVGLFLLAGGCLGDCLDVYFIQNLFDYSGTPMTMTGHLYNALAYLRTQSAANPFLAGFAVLGFVWCAASALREHRRGFLPEILMLPVGAGLLLLFCYWGEMAHPYYALVFSALVPCGFLPLSGLSLPGNRLISRSLISLGALLPLLAAFLVTSGDARGALRKIPRDQMVQTRFAERMHQDGGEMTMLDLCSLDQGFYLASGILPTCRYFANNNLDTQEKKDAIRGYLENADTRYIVSVYTDPGEHYELIDEAAGVFDLNDQRSYKLYRRIGS